MSSKFSKVLKLALFVLLCSAAFILSGCSSASNSNVPDFARGDNNTNGGGSSSSGGTSVKSTPLEPRVAPQTPASIPPKTAKNGKIAAAAIGKTDTCTIKLPKGWSLVSFPFAKLSSVSGLEYQLKSYEGQDYVNVDPTVNPEKIDTTRAFWAYTDEAATFTATGVLNEGQLGTIELQAGWNLIGCPYSADLPCKNMSMTRQGSLRTMEQASSSSYTQDESWIFRMVSVNANNAAGSAIDVSSSSSAFKMGGAHWVFAWNEAEININAGVEDAPVLTYLSSPTLAAGSRVTVNGSGFGSAEEDSIVITVDGVTIEGANINSWTSNSVEFTVPTGLSSGSLVIFRNSCPSNALSVTVSPSDTADVDPSVYGLVTDPNGTALQNAQITLDSGHSALTDSHGEFYLYGVPAGQYVCFVSKIGYNTGVSQITVEEGVTRRVRAELSPVSSGSSGGDSGDAAGTFYVRAVKRVDNGSEFYVTKIKVVDPTSYSNRWTETWDVPDSYRELKVDGAILGRRYNVAITWSNGQTKMFGHHEYKMTRNGANVEYDD